MDVMKALKQLPDESVDMCVTSPPYYGQRDYQVEEQIGIEKHPNDYINKLIEVFSEVKRVLKKQGSFWLNLGDTFWGSNQGYGTTKRNTDTGFQDVRKGYFASSNKKPPMSNTKLKSNWLQPKQLMLIPSRVAIALQNELGFILRNDLIWWKPNCMPDSTKDRFTIDYEHLFFFVKNRKYYFEQQFEPIKTETIKRNKYGWDGSGKGIYSIGRKRKPGEFVTKIPKEMAEQIGSPRASYHRMPPIGGKKHTEGNFNPTYSGNQPEWNELGRNKRCVWKINTSSHKDAHFAIFPNELIKTPILAGCPKGGIVLDPFIGSGTTAEVARELGRDCIGIEINPEYIKIIKKRLFGGNQSLIDDFKVIK